MSMAEATTTQTTATLTASDHVRYSDILGHFQMLKSVQWRWSKQLRPRPPRIMCGR